MNTAIQQDIEFITNSKLINWERFKGKAVLISGANGMLPLYMVETLLFLNKNWGYSVKVVALVRNLEKAKRVFDEHVNDGNLEFLVQGDTKPVHYIGGIHYIVHAASQAAPSYYG